MQFRENTKYDPSTGKTINIFKNMTPVQFRERYGMSFREWKLQLSKDDCRKKLKFNECYVDDDPYASDVFGKTDPLIEDSPSKLEQSCIESAYEI